MQYTVSKEKSEVTLAFVTTEEEWKAAEAKAYQETKGKYRVPGFRQGKAPKHMIEQMYGTGVFADDTMDVLIREGYELFFEENKDVYPIDRPSASIDEFDGKSLKFTLKFPVMPEVKLGEYKGVKVPKVEYKVTDEQVQAELDRTAEYTSKIEEKEGAAEDGDIVNLNYSGSVDGVKFDGGTADNYDLTLGSHTFIPGFEEQLIGLKAGDEKDVKVTFPEEYHAENLKGKEAVFACKVNKVSHKVKPEMNDEWAKEVSSCDTLEAYKADIRNHLEESAKHREKTEKENNVINAIVDKSEADIPDVLVQSYLDDMLKDMENRMMYQGLKLEDYFKYMGTTVEEYRKNHYDDAKRGALTRLVLEQLIKEEKITATDEEAEKAYNEVASKYGAAGDDAKKPTEQELNYFKQQVVMDKLLDMLTSNAVYEEKKADEKAE